MFDPRLSGGLLSPGATFASTANDARSDGERVRAVQYVRTSSDRQQHSLENQVAAIAEYAGDRGYEIVATYVDAGKSGLSLKGRHGLQQLLAAVLRPSGIFDAILVFDVSRWGRFQNPDQAGHYEFICRQAGLTVAYCAEPFENNLSPTSTIAKHLKRVMAREYSRELSERLSRPRPAGQSRLSPGWKHALWVSQAEEEWVRVQMMSPIIPEHLFWKAQAGLITHRWEIMPTEQILDGLRRLLREKGRLSQSLIKNCKYLPNPNTLALRFGGLSQVFALIGYERPKTFFHPNRARHLMDEDIFAGLRRLHQQHGYLTRQKINQDRILPCATSIKQRFGSIYRAYALSGLPPVTHSQVTTAARTRRKLREDAIRKSGLKLKTVYTTDELIVGLQRILKKHGYISARLIDQDPFMPTAQTVGVRFGSHRKAYKLAGWSRTHRQIALAALKSRYRDSNVGKGPKSTLSSA